jgi:hypothetical protein
VDSTSICALRLQEAGVIKSTPQKHLAQGLDWRLLNELKKELKDWEQDYAASCLATGCDRVEFDTQFRLL